MPLSCWKNIRGVCLPDRDKALGLDGFIMAMFQEY